MTRISLVFLVLIAACQGGSAEDRHAIGKADLVGSCTADSCGDKSSGNCWCDDLCSEFGDCCANKASVCDGGGATCGGLQGKGCGDGEFCDFSEDAACGANDQTGTCAAIPEACAQEVDPVCGCDGNTYQSACEAHAAGVAVSKHGGCDACGGITGKTCGNGKFCDFGDGGSCGADDQTGTCAAIPDACAQEVDPVCGCDGNTYANACEAHAAGTSVAKQGICKECGGLFPRPCCPGGGTSCGLECVDNPFDSCDESMGGNDCSKMCVPSGN